ncbi:MAG: hypothetical protein SGI74_02040 [Oligoflexia bacterium]|nr:hypothetical protein [Oligoflexia bacterium]
MDNETATALTDVILSFGTIALGLTVGPRKFKHLWMAFFIMLSIAALLGAIYHGTVQFHTPSFWILVSISSVTSAFLLLAACISVTKPNLPWLNIFWPVLGFIGILIGGLVAPLPFIYISIVSGFCLITAALTLTKAPASKARSWIYTGMAVTIFGLVIREVTNFDGLLSRNALFHLIQLAGNFLFWKGARKT